VHRPDEIVTTTLESFLWASASSKEDLLHRNFAKIGKVLAALHYTIAIPPHESACTTVGKPIMTDPKYKAFTALDPFFDIVQRGLAGQVDGDHFFDTIADNAVFEYRYIFPGYPQRLDGREALMALYAAYGNNILLHSADALVVHRSQDPRVVILEYEVHGKIIRTGASYDNRFISVVTIGDREIVHWRDYMDSLTAMTALSQRQ
jgi:ketosteroid isomerase-like protein